jgi:hypothetical protein
VVWFAAVTVFFVYFFYTGVTYTTPYLTGVLGASLALTTILANVRTMGVTLISGPVFGLIANRVKPSLVIVGGSGLFIVAMFGLMALPVGGGVVVGAALVILLGFIANGVFGVVSAQLTEGSVPLHYFGAATGILSVIGFLPDTFSSTWFGAIMDAHLDAEGTATAGAYTIIFWILIGAAALAIATAALLFLYVRKNSAQLKAKAEASIAASGR